MRTRRGSEYWTSQLSRHMAFEEGDIVTAVVTGDAIFHGVVRSVDRKVNKVLVAWGGGSVVQHDPDEIQLIVHGGEEMGRRLAAAKSRRATSSLTKTAAKKIKYRGYAIEKSGMNYYVTDSSGHRAFGEVPASVSTAKKWIDQEIGGKRKAVDEMPRSRRAMTPEEAESDPQFVGDPETHGIDEPRGGGFSIMQNLQKDLHEESKDEADENPKITDIHASDRLRSRRAMYWCAPDRTYLLSKPEQANGTPTCPKCKGGMDLQPFTKSEKLYVCECGFKVPRSKTVSERPVVETGPPAEVEVLTSRRGL